MSAHSRTIEVSAADLPACCPPSGGENWNLHPRVFLPLSPSSPLAACPYCGAKFVLKSEAAESAVQNGGAFCQSSAAELERQ